MAKTTGRLCLTLDRPMQARLRLLSEKTGISQSGLIAELLEGAAPELDKVLRRLQAAEDARRSLTGLLGQEVAQAAESMLERADQGEPVYRRRRPGWEGGVVQAPPPRAQAKS